MKIERFLLTLSLSFEFGWCLQKTSSVFRCRTQKQHYRISRGHRIAFIEMSRFNQSESAHDHSTNSMEEENGMGIDQMRPSDKISQNDLFRKESDEEKVRCLWLN